MAAVAAEARSPVLPNNAVVPLSGSGGGASGGSKPLDGKSVGAGAAPVQKVRIAYLDHVKLLCMCSVWWIHGMAYGIKYCQKDDEYPGRPAWQGPLSAMLHKYNMSFFALCSGSVSKYEATPDQLQNSFTTLIMPCICFHLWYQLTWYWPSGEGFDWAHFLVNMEPWYMKTLFAWRILLFSLGHFSDWVLLGIAVGARLAWQMEDLSLGTLEGHIILDAPFFVLGHVLVRRKKLLEPYVEFLNNRMWLRVACGIGYLLFWIDSITYGYNGIYTEKFFDMFPDTRTGRLFYDVFWMMQTVLYGFIATGWLPTSHMTFWSETGKWTLYAYLQNYDGILVFLKIWKKGFPHPSTTVWWIVWLTAMPLVTMLLCSEPFRFMLWPIAQPSWFGKHPRDWQFDKLCDVELAKKAGLKVWLACEVVFHAVWMSALYMMGPPQCFKDTLYTP